MPEHLPKTYQTQRNTPNQIFLEHKTQTPKHTPKSIQKTMAKCTIPYPKDIPRRTPQTCQGMPKQCNTHIPRHHTKHVL